MRGVPHVDLVRRLRNLILLLGPNHLPLGRRSHGLGAATFFREEALRELGLPAESTLEYQDKQIRLSIIQNGWKTF